MFLADEFNGLLRILGKNEIYDVRLKSVFVMRKRIRTESLWSFSSLLRQF